MLEHGVRYGQAVTSTEVQQQDTTRVQIRGAVPPNHTPPGITVVAHMGVEVPQQNYGVPSRSTLQHPSQGLQELGSIEQAVDKCGLQRITLLREISIKTGIQLLIRDYQFDAKNKPVFTEEDILNIFPIIKHVIPKANDGIYLLHCGQTSIQQGRLKEGCELISQALGLFTNVYGALHQDVCVCLRLLGRIYYILGDYAEALSHQQKAVLISERVLGIDHPNTIQEYKHLGLYCFADGQTSTALRLLYRARYLMLLVCGEDHPEMALLDSKIGLVLHGVMQCDLALKFLENALALTSKYQGPTSLKVAQGHHLLAKVYESKGEFRLALRHEKERYMIYRSQGAGGNWATVGRRSRGGRRVRRQREKRKGKSVGLRIGTLNVGTMTGKGRELADVMERRKVDILCVQETRWKGSKARSIGAGFKLFYYGVDSKRNGVGVVLKEEFVRNVLEVKRVSDRVMSLKLEIEGVMLNVVSGYAPQVGCELEEKERLWSELDEVMESIPTGERVVIGADFNGHVGEGNTGDEEVMGKFGVKERNLEGQMVVDFAKRMDMGVVNTYFQKREEHRVTYKSGGRSTQVDYILCRRGNLKEISDCKVVVGENVARQHRMVVCRMTLMVCKKKRSKKIEKKTKWWKLKKEECCEEFRQKLRQALGGQVVLPDDWETTAEVIRETGRKVLGVSSGRRKEDKETWWWNEEVQDSIQRKRLAKKKWDMDRTEENRQEYKELQRRVKREVSKAKQKAYDELYTRLDTREGEKDLYRLARQRDRDGKDVQQVRVIKDRDGRVLTSEESVQRRWKEYFEVLMNEENEREKRVEGVNSVEQKVDKIRKDEVRKALKRMKSGKAVGPDDIPVEVWKCLGEAAVEFLASLFNRVLESERMPEEWRRSVLVPIFKNKGDVQSCSNYRGIKLMSHTMKVWERVVEARLRKVVEICEQQYGFMPRKSTTDAIFALRILMEKYRDGQRELHCVFVDLEKAYDRVPREELWYCMRKSGVAEKYVRVVQDMYERSRTVVRCAVGQTEEFNVEVGLHQGSALSPFLFAIVMDQLSEEVRQESPWTMMFADDIVICSESREQVEENLERWRFALERRGMKVSRSKTEYMCVNEREGSGTVRLQGEEVKKVQEFKYLGSTVQSNGECGKEVGEAHEKTQESSEYLKHLTNQAVILQRTMNMIYKNRSGYSITPLTLATPSRLWIVEQLNLVTGIVFIPLSTKDLETLRDNTQNPSA
ncbi:hypothetical protein QTP86_028946 [Hemibagrus guttatus]|nr:hypothetical protein QTP86_028946 [Hemibagrus guttatus]